MFMQCARTPQVGSLTARHVSSYDRPFLNCLLVIFCYVILPMTPLCICDIHGYYLYSSPKGRGIPYLTITKWDLSLLLEWKLLLGEYGDSHLIKSVDSLKVDETDFLYMSVIP